MFLAFDLKELQIVCKPRHMKCFQTIFSSIYLLTSNCSQYSPDFFSSQVKFYIYMQKKHTIFCQSFEPTFQFLSYIIYKLLHTKLYISVHAGSSSSSTSAALITPFLILQRSMIFMAKQMKNVAGYQAKYFVILRLVLKCDRYDETNGKLPMALTNKIRCIVPYPQWKQSN